MTKAKILTAAFVAGTLAVGVGTQVLPTAEAQPGPGGLPGAGFSGPFTPGIKPDPRSGYPGIPSSGSGSMTRPAPISYEFLPRPKGSDAFKKLLVTRGADGWEYVGTVPGDDELIFKKLPSTSGHIGGTSGMPGMAMPGGGMGMGTSAPTGGGPTPMGGSGTGPPPVMGGGGGMPPSAPMAGGSGSAGGLTPVKAVSTLTLRAGETVRHRMSQGQAIHGFYQNSKSLEVTLDPTDATRVLIRGVSAGEARLDLTDASGSTELVSIKVK